VVPISIVVAMDASDHNPAAGESSCGTRALS
jgi:hypothetical protein